MVEQACLYAVLFKLALCVWYVRMQGKYEQIATEMVNKLVSSRQQPQVPQQQQIQQQQVQQQPQQQQVQGMQMQQAQVMQPQMQQPQAMAMQQPGMQGAAANCFVVELLSCSCTVAVGAGATV
jgi:hypothetical protein